MPAMLFDRFIMVRAKLVIAHEYQNESVHPGRSCPQYDEYVHVGRAASDGLVCAFVEPETHAKLNHR